MKLSEIKAEAEELQRVRELRAVATLILALVAVAEAAQAHIVDTEGDIEEPCDLPGCLLCKTRAALAKLEDL